MMSFVKFIRQFEYGMKGFADQIYQTNDYEVNNDTKPGCVMT